MHLVGRCQSRREQLIEMKVFECKNSACTLGTPGNPGRFSGGAEKEAITLITGDPEPEHFGEGVCPNCGTKGTEVKDVPPPHKGTDPYQELHDEAAKKASDEDDPATRTAAAQSSLEAAVEKAENKGKVKSDA